MRGLVPAAALALLLLAGCGGEDAGTPAEPAGDREMEGALVLSYEEPSAESEDAAALLEDSGRLDEVVDALNESLELPDDLPVRVTDDEEAPYFDPEVPEIVYDYGFVDSMLELFAADEPDADAEQHVEDALSFTEWVLYHEIGHALIAELELPVVGREEDAADSLATVLATELVEDGDEIAFSAALGFLLLGEETDEVTDQDFFDEHSLDEQRFAQILCWVYGSDPEAWEGAVEEGALPAERAEGCEEEYEQQVASWSELLDLELGP